MAADHVEVLVGLCLLTASVDVDLALDSRR